MPSTPNAREHHHRAARPGAHRGARALLVLVGALLSMTACSPRHAGADAQAATTRATSRPALAWTVNATRVTPRLATTSMETRQAPPGYQFVVLDVSVRNRDNQPRVLTEGTLVAMDETGLQRFDQPETLLSDDYLSLQVLAPAQQRRGKIAFEVPAPLSGVLFWHPGDGGERILLNPTVLPGAVPRTLADADADADSNVDGAAAATADLQADVDAGAGDRDRAPRPRDDTPPSDPPADAHDIRDARREASASELQRHRDVAASARATSAPTARAGADVQVDAGADGRDASPAASPSDTVADAREQARIAACQGLVARDDPAEKAGQLAFFAQSCRDFTLPAHWQPPTAPRPSLLARASARASALVARIVLRPHVERIADCAAATSDADRLVCGNPGLAAMDQQLARSVTRARAQVEDPSALQREQSHWRDSVRDACRSARCLERAYGRRIVQLDALASRQP